MSAHYFTFQRKIVSDCDQHLSKKDPGATDFNETFLGVSRSVKICPFTRFVTFLLVGPGNGAEKYLIF